MSDPDFDSHLRNILQDREHGASELARRCLTLLAEIAEHAPADDSHGLRALLDHQAGRLAEARPSMAPVGNLLERWRHELARRANENDLSLWRRQAAAVARELAAASLRAVDDLSAHGAALLGPGRTIMTHSLSSTVLAVFRALKDSGLEVIVTESRPLCEGRRLAEQLSRWEVPVTYITDAQMGLFVARADAVLVGADSLLADGSVVNKSGTYPLALLAREQAVPFYVCCESFKRWRGSDQPPLEEMAAEELGVEALPQVSIRNIYFEITPARWVSAWISEQGIVRGSGAGKKNAGV